MAQISGSSSADVLTGTSENDVFSGGANHDIFVFTGRGGVDTIVDFGATYFSGAITGSQEVPGNASTASGTHTGWLNRAQTEFNFTATITGLDLGGQTAATTDNVTAAHFHRAVAGASGGVVFGFIGAPNNELQGETVVNAAAGTVSGSWDLTEGQNTTLTAQASFLTSNQLYINFHTSVFPSGEIRGQTNAVDFGLDRIDVSSLGIGDYTTLQQVMTEAAGATTISVYWNDVVHQLVLNGVSMARLSAADFIFSTDTWVRTAFGTALGDDLFGGIGADFLFGEAGDDDIFAGAGADLAEGRDGNDTIVGMDGDDQALGGAGADNVNGNAGTDLVYGDAGADTVRGGQDADSVFGGAGDDPHVNGNMGDDVVRGGDGNDTVYGGQGNDSVYGENGNDVVHGDLGLDLLWGGFGADRFVLRAGSNTDWVQDFNFDDGDRIQLATGTAYTTSNVSGQVMINLASGDSLGLSGSVFANFNTSWIVFV